MSRETHYIRRLLAGLALGTASIAPVTVLAGGSASAAPVGDDELGTPTTNPCWELGTCPGDDDDHCDPDHFQECEPPDECDPETQLCEPPHCDPEVEQCWPDEPECEVEEECPDDEPGDDPGDDDPGDDPDSDPVDPPVPGRPTFTG